MLPWLQVALLLLSLLQGVAAGPLEVTPRRQHLAEIIHIIHRLSSGVQVPCNDTRVAQVPFTDRKLPEQELLCQAAKALTKVTKCKKDYELLIINLKRLHSTKTCSLSDENEIYLRNFLPELGNFTQGLCRRPELLVAP